MKNIKINFFKKIIIFFVLFIYIFDIKVNFFPFYLSYILSVLGGIIFLKDIKKARNLFQVKFILNLFFSFFLVFVSYLLTYVVNQNGDFYFLKEIVVLDVLLVFGGYFVFSLFKKYYKYVDIHIVLYYYLMCIIIQLVLSLLMFFSQSVYFLLDSMLLRSELESIVVEGTRENRLIGFGVAFFTSGVMNSIALVLIVFYSLLERKIISSTFLLSSFVFISVVGVMMSRTTMIGVIVAIIYYLFNKRNMFKAKYIFVLFLCSAFFFLGTFFFDTNLFNQNSKLSVIVDFGFELFENVFIKGEFSTNSTSKMLEMYKIIPDNLKTWFIGDGYFRSSLNPELGYYKGTDIGIYRLIFNGGLIGVVFFLLLQYKVVFNLKRSFSFAAVIVVCIMLFIFNLKGVVDYLKFICLFAFLDVNLRNKRI